MAIFQIRVNGQRREVDASPEMPLLWVLRDLLKLSGTKYGCGIGQCGACTVHLDGVPVRSCSLPVEAVSDKSIVTIEGLSEDGDHPVQLAWDEVDVPQCGYCQAGHIMTVAALLEEIPNPTDADIDDKLRGHICRCGTYLRLRQAVHLAADKKRHS